MENSERSSKVLEFQKRTLFISDDFFIIFKNDYLKLFFKWNFHCNGGKL